MKKILYTTLAMAMLCGCTTTKAAPAATAKPTEGIRTSESETLYSNANVIRMYGDHATLNGEAMETSDYTWHCDPTTVHDEVKNAPAEYYTGTKLETEKAAYIDHELYYYPKLDESGFKLVSYDGEPEWAYYYQDGENNDYIFGTLAYVNDKEIPVEMMHTEEEAAEYQVLHITQPGIYVLEGTWKGQIWIDLGDEAFSDENAKATVVLNGVDIDCGVAPGLVFYQAYECDNTWEDKEEHTADIDTTNAGATVVLVEGSENTVHGTNVYRMLKTKYKDEESAGSYMGMNSVPTQKKMRKIDGAFYSFVTMNIEGTGKLTINSEFEGLDTELHLNIKGGDITINALNDGININEDNVSVGMFTGGSVTINGGQGDEGDGIDSNGYIVIDGATLNINGIVAPDSALDSEDGIYYKSGTVIINGEEQTYEPGSVFRESSDGGPGAMFKMDLDIRELKEQVAALPDDATFEDIMALFRNQDNMPPGGGMGGPGGQGRPDDQEGMNKPDDRPQGDQPQINIQEIKEKVAALSDDASYDEVMAIFGMNFNRPDGQGRPDGMPQGGPDGQPPEMPQGGQFPEMTDTQSGASRKQRNNQQKQ